MINPRTLLSGRWPQAAQTSSGVEHPEGQAMKQKNMILIGVAVACGLIAAVLTSQMSGKPAAVIETVDIPVAANELAIGTRFTKENYTKAYKLKAFPKDALPAEYLMSPEELIGKRLSRSLRLDDVFNPKDLSSNMPIQPPPGYNMMTMHCTAERGVAGFAGPGSKVDILASVLMKSQENKAIVFPIMIDMLVLAIDTTTTLGDGAVAVPTVNMVSLAVTPEQARILHASMNRGADLRLILRHPEKAPEWKNKPTEEEIWQILADQPKRKEEPKTELKETPEIKLVKIVTAKEAVKAGTQLTAGIISEEFTTIEVTAPAPTGMIINLVEHSGRYLTKDLVPGQFVPSSYLADKPAPEPEVAPAPKPVQEAKKEEAPIVPLVKKVYHDVTVKTTTGTVRHRYEKLSNGELVYVGVVRDVTTEAEEELRRQLEDARESARRAAAENERKNAPKPAPAPEQPKPQQAKPGDVDL
jgi:pilus assembly protein CpaB